MMDKTMMMAESLLAKEICLHEFLIEMLSEELEDAEMYHKHAKRAKHYGDSQLANMLLQHSKDELRHFESITEMLEKLDPNIKANPLYPLVQDLEEWAEDIEEEINAIR